MILAAGEASRMGRVKQMLTHHGKSLIQLAIENALVTGCKVVVVLGAHSKQIMPTIEHYPARLVPNHRWKNGIGTSIRSGIDTALDIYPDLKGVTITLADQPLVTPKHLTAIMRLAETTNAQIIASVYQNTFGVPAYFSSAIFNELMELSGDSGAKSIIQKHEQLVTGIQFDDGAVDIDTKEDWQEYTEQYD